MKQSYSTPAITEYGPAERLTLGGGDSSIDWSVSFDPCNPSNNSVGSSPGSGCLTLNGTKYGACS